MATGKTQAKAPEGKVGEAVESVRKQLKSGPKTRKQFEGFNASAQVTLAEALEFLVQAGEAKAEKAPFTKGRPPMFYSLKK